MNHSHNQKTAEPKMANPQPLFEMACRLANSARDPAACKDEIRPTKRQWNKWRRGQGMAFRSKNEAERTGGAA